MSDRTIPIHTGCSSREDLAIYVEGFMKGSMTAVWLIVERHLASSTSQQPTNWSPTSWYASNTSSTCETISITGGIRVLTVVA